MKIAFCHNFYQQPGGEDQVFRDESTMMEENGHEVMRYTRHNDEIKSMSKFSLVKKTFWNRQSYQELTETFSNFRPDVVHFTNTFPLISPAAYKAARVSGAVVVQSLHNFRMICPGSLLLRNGKTCETCIKKTFALPSVWHKCYRDSYFASAVTAGMNAWHRLRGTGEKYVNQFISLTKFTKDKFVESGFDPDKISVKQNFVTRTIPADPTGKNNRALFVGRLAKEKGIDVLLDCWESLDPSIPLDIVGDGPLADYVKQRISHLPQVKFHGLKDHEEVKRMMQQAMVQIVPSTYYETFGLVVIEAFSVGTPAIVSNHGSLAELVDPEITGLRFAPGNPMDLAEQVQKIASNETLRNQMGIHGQAEYESKYTREKNYEILHRIYDQTIEESKQ